MQVAETHCKPEHSAGEHLGGGIDDYNDDDGDDCSDDDENIWEMTMMRMSKLVSHTY